MYDVAVVGAGPAGSSAALKLAKAGANVVLLEKEALPRYKVCGGGVTHRARALLGFDIGGVVEREFFAATLTLLESGLSFTARRDQPLISMTMRSQFDQLLVANAQKAGAEIRTETRVHALTCLGGNLELETSAGGIAAKFVLAADGANSTIARQAGWRETRPLIPAIEAEIYVSDREMERFANTARFDFDMPPDGYAWLFPKREHLSVGVLSTKRGHVGLAPLLNRYLGVLGIQQVKKEVRRGFVIPMKARRDGFVRNGVMLVGDAAGFVDPVSGEGICFAIKSGQLAADALVQSCFDWSRSKSAYETLIEQQITPELSTAGLMAKMLYSPRVRTFAFKHYGSRFTDVFADVVMGVRSYGEISRLTHDLGLLRFMF